MDPRDRDRDPRRRFTRIKDRVRLYLDADGRCTSCGKELPVGWHADHVIPHSKGGRTELWNGAALCAECNTHKGARSPDQEDDMSSSSADGYVPREWAKAAKALVIERIEEGEQDTLVNVAPAGGKTRFALATAQDLIERGVIDKIIVVVPTVGIGNQFVTDANKLHGLKIGFASNATDGRARSPESCEHGVVVTYHTLSNQPELYKKQLGRRGLVIFDEVHHLSDGDGWGVQAQIAFKDALHRISMTGTAFRSDGRRIPFVRYDEEDFVLPNHSYTWKEAWSSDIIRKVMFPQWGSKSVIVHGDSYDLSECTSDDLLRGAYRSMHHSKSEWLRSAVSETHKYLMESRRILPNAGALLLARDQEHARYYVGVVRSVTGTEPALIISEDPETDPHDEIDKFRDSDVPWLISVRMVSEGINIPRLTTLLYASNYETPLFFQQAVGRVVRKVNGDAGVLGVVVFPPTPNLVENASYLERQLAMVEHTPGPDKPRDPADTPPEIPYTEPARDGHDEGTVIDGELFGPDMVRRAKRYAERNGSSYSATDIVQMLKDGFITTEQIKEWEVAREDDLVAFVDVSGDIARTDDLRVEYNKLKNRVTIKQYKLDNGINDSDKDVVVPREYFQRIGVMLQGVGRKVSDMTLKERELLVADTHDYEASLNAQMKKKGLM